MVLVPTDLASLRERNPQLQLTPEQWQLFTWADGRTSLQMICNTGRYPANLVCQVVGELIALGLVYLLPPVAPVYRPMPVATNAVTAGLSNGYMAPVYTAQPGAAFMPTTGTLPSPASAPLVAGYGQGRYSQPLPLHDQVAKLPSMVPMHKREGDAKPIPDGYQAGYVS